MAVHLGTIAGREAFGKNTKRLIFAMKRRAGWFRTAILAGHHNETPRCCFVVQVCCPNRPARRFIAIDQPNLLSQPPCTTIHCDYQPQLLSQPPCATFHCDYQSYLLSQPPCAAFQRDYQPF